jgi:L-iditol 2-dehydrogenase
MKAAFLTGIRRLQIFDIPEPELTTPHDVLLRIDTVGVCGSDVHYYTMGRIGTQVVKFPERVGHECAGTVVKVGGEASGLRVGQRVAVDPLISCGQCDQCQSGRRHTCRRQRFLGNPGEAPGALAEVLTVPAESCYPVPDHVTQVQAALVEPLSIALHAQRLSGIRRGAEIAVLGSGPIGLCVLLACRAAGAGGAYVTDLVEERLEVAQRCGATWTGNPQKTDVVAAIAQLRPLGLDCAFECAGQQQTLDQAVEVLKPGGQLLIVGIPELDRVSFSIHTLRRKEIQIRNVRRQNHCTAPAVEMISCGAVNVDPLVTHHFSIAQTKEAFNLVDGYRGGVVKAIIHVSGSHGQCSF